MVDTVLMIGETEVIYKGDAHRAVVIIRLLALDTNYVRKNNNVWMSCDLSALYFECE